MAMYGDAQLGNPRAFSDLAYCLAFIAGMLNRQAPDDPNAWLAMIRQCMLNGEGQEP